MTKGTGGLTMVGVYNNGYTIVSVYVWLGECKPKFRIKLIVLYFQAVEFRHRRDITIAFHYNGEFQHAGGVTTV